MKEKSANTGKRRVAVVALCAMLILALGTTVAASAAGEAVFMQIKNENGAISYSEDGGQTWNEGFLDGTVVQDDGKAVRL